MAVSSAAASLTSCACCETRPVEEDTRSAEAAFSSRGGDALDDLERFANAAGGHLGAVDVGRDDRRDALDRRGQVDHDVGHGLVGAGHLAGVALRRLGRLEQLVERLTGVLGQRRALLNFLHGDVHRLGGALGAGLDGRDDRPDLLGRRRRLLGELADLAGDDGEALALIAGAGRLDRGVQGEQVGLGGDVLDGADDLADLLGAGVGLLDRRRRGVDGALDRLHLRQGLANGVRPALGRGHGLDRRGHDRFRARPGDLDGFGDVAGGLGQAVGGLGLVAGAAGDGFDRLGDARDAGLALVIAAASLVAASAICEMFSAIWLVARPEDWAEPAMASLTSISFWARCESWSIRPRRLDDSELNVATGTPEATTRLMLATRPVSMIIVAMAS